MKLKNLLPIIFTAFIVAVVGFSLEERAEETVIRMPLKHSDFKEVEGSNGNFMGTVQLTGYPTIIKYGNDDNGVYSVSENALFNCMGADCPSHKYVMFNVLDSSSDNIYDFINTYSGNSFVDEKGIGLGCPDDNQLYYNYYSGKSDQREFRLSRSNSEEIWKATKDDPITITLKKESSNFEGQGPYCFSYFEIVNW